jgi:hypothetical protein
MSTGVTAAVVAGEGVFPARIVTGVSNVPTSIARFVALEVVEGFRAAPRERSVIAVTRIVAVVDVAVKAGMAVEPGASSDKHTAIEPIWSVVAVGCAVVGFIVEVAIGAPRRHANTDRDLGRHR